jgi:hypothetical protein
MPRLRRPSGHSELERSGAGGREIEGSGDVGGLSRMQGAPGAETGSAALKQKYGFSCIDSATRMCEFF